MMRHNGNNTGICTAYPECRANWSRWKELFGKVHGCYSYRPWAWKWLMPSDSSGARRGGLDRKKRGRGGVKREWNGERGKSIWVVLNERKMGDEPVMDEAGMRNIGRLKKRYCRNSIVFVPTTEKKIGEPFLFYLCDMLKSRFISELVLDIFSNTYYRTSRLPCVLALWYWVTHGCHF